MLLDNNIVTDREAKSGALAGWLGREEGIEHFFLYFRQNANTIVPNPDLHAVTEAFGRSPNGRLEPVTAQSLGSRVEAVRDQIQ
jgi:hypothetical protein